MRGLRLFAVLSIVALGLVLPSRVSAGPAKWSTCQFVATTDVILVTDLTCPNTATFGIDAAASGITIDLGGHSLIGRSSTAQSPQTAVVVNVPDVTIRNGSIVFFDAGITGNGADRLRLDTVFVQNNEGSGLSVTGESVQIVSSGAFANDAYGFQINGSSARVEKSNANGNGFAGVDIARDRAPSSR